MGNLCSDPVASKRTVRVREHDARVGVEPAQVVPGPVQHSGTKKALLIGINYPGTSAELRGCVNDVKAMMQYLQQNGFNNIKVLHDGGGAELPTRANIMAGARWLVQDAKIGDALFFHFSGHGAQQEDPRFMEEDAMDETIVPCDFAGAGMIVDDELFDALVATLPSGCRLTAVMDCCHSGTGLDLPFTHNAYGGVVMDDNPCHSLGDVRLFSGVKTKGLPRTPPAATASPVER
mmetsp:Transcript_33440/g.86914  ORF Transcript_33440/g.86914 Transcript_33440/m.86914 type:complete len:234 (-) Transcript_33440:886-1587(-)